ncbi:protein CIP2A homolog L isoform X2 [Periplaneta americana]
MEKYQHMKAFISSAMEYSKHRTEKTSSSLQRHLQILGVTSDMSLFDPGSSVAAEFYVSLHELMSCLESQSVLVWCAIRVLQHACHNPAARHALIHTYKFAPILTKLLGTNLTQEKRIRVLQLLQELTYGVKIAWQEAHLPYLISTLTSWIVSEDKDVKTLSLGVLVNLCYKNLPAVYTLMRSVDSKQFLRTILKLQNDNISTRVQVCKLLIILEQFSGEIADTDILNFVNVTFSTVGDAFKASDVFLLKHMVDFFKDVQTNPHFRDVVLTYNSFPRDTEQLLLLLGNDNADPECVGMLFEFLHSLVTLKVAGLGRLYPQLVSLAVQWIRSEVSCKQSLSLICSVVVDVRHGGGDAGIGEVQQNVMSQLEQGLSNLLLLLELEGDENFPTNSEVRIRITALLQLLQEMCKAHSLRQRILQNIKHQIIKRIFQPLLSAEPRDGDNMFQGEVTDLYVHALDFMSDLASHDGQWLSLYSSILQYKQVHMILAVALFTGKEDIKRRVLTLTGTVGFPAESVAILAKSLCDLEPLVLVESNSGIGKITMGIENGSGVQHNMTPLFSLAQEGRLDHFIAKMEDALERNEIRNISTSAVMELYEYKIAAMAHSERALQASLEAANNHSTHLHHRLTQMSAEASKLHQLLYHNQQCVEGLQQEKNASICKLEAARISAEDEHKKHLSEMKVKQRLINELNTMIEELKRNVAAKEDSLSLARQELDGLNKQIEDLHTQIMLLEQKNRDQLSTNSDLTRTLSKLEERISKRERIIEEKANDIDKLQKKIQALEGELNNYKMLCKAQEKNIQEKEEEMNATQLQLNELQRMREVIYEISAGKKKMDK